ncbi:ABC transporter ATP-binding protein [Fumia xinanensis]|uniref:ABC transporter ATP-binding protein n=1 Tax=Fumia xinanensis TaxID=2763659 RepID=A0A926E2H6_9FIRM|nr:ABC transporter ATP-binding protein [Fumia xinanensis]MBC8558548.1 ABC transporter ATP-binding protein [Fumia xinanensis]
MKKIMKYLKPFAGSIAVAVVLVFVQAMCDLKLPDYMSNIVNVGIQQSGITDAVPEKIRASEVEKLFLFLSEDEQSLIAKHYLGEASEAGGDYWILQKKGLSSSDRKEMNTAFARAFATVGTMESLEKDPDTLQKVFGELSGQALPGGNVDLIALVSSMPFEQRMQIADKVIAEYEALGESMLTQAAVQFVKEEYEAIQLDTVVLQRSYIIRTGGAMLLVSLLAAACTVVVGFLGARIGSGLARDLRKRVFRKVEDFSNAEFDKFSTASLITRTTNDVIQVQMLVIMAIRMVIYAPVMGIGGTIYALQKSVSMSWIIALAVILLLGLMLTIFITVMPKFKSIQKLIDRLNQVTRENLSGLMVSRAYNTQKFEEQRFDGANQNLMKTQLFVNRVMAAMMPVMMLIMNGVNVLIIWVGAHQIAAASMQVGDMMAYMQYAMQVVMSFLALSMMFIMFPRAAVSGDRIAEVLDTEISIRDPEHPVGMDSDLSRTGIVEFKDVTFRFPGAEEDTLHHISFTAKPGETTAFIGSTGSGKSTLVNLIPRFYDATEGTVTVNGVDVRNAAQHDLREQIGYVPQKAILFSGTIDSNLKYGDADASEEAVRIAAETAQAMEFIESKPDKFDEPIAQGGTNVSGGQKQRLSIARALVKQPPIYIFDDSFSALDFKTDAALRRALKKQTGNATVLLVAQRVGTIRHAEQIIVLDEGKIVGKGTHEELMENCEVYQQIAYSQLSKEELA